MQAFAISKAKCRPPPFVNGYVFTVVCSALLRTAAHCASRTSRTNTGTISIHASVRSSSGSSQCGIRWVLAQVWRTPVFGSAESESSLQCLPKCRSLRTDGKQLLPVWIIDEAQNLPVEFFRDLPAFLNFAFDSRDLISVWLVGHPGLAQTLERAPYAALHGRIAARVQLRPVVERERFALLIGHALKSAGCQHTLLADSGMEVLRQASKGLPRMAGRILRTAMRRAVPKGLNHLPDDLLQQAIDELR